MPAVTTYRTRLRLPRAAALLCALLLGALGALFLAPAPANAQGAACAASPTTGCIGGTIRTSGGAPAVGVDITVTGASGEFTAQTDDAGRWSVAITDAGEYEVTLDEATLPAGESLREGTPNPRTVNAVPGRNAAAAFPLGGGAAPAPSPTDSGEDGEAATDGDADGDVGPGGSGGTTGGGAGGGTNRVLQLTLSGLVFGLLLALAAVGANLIYGTTGLSNFAHGDLVTLGGLLAFSAAQWWGMPLWLAIITATALGGVAGYVLNAGIFAPLRRRRIGITQQMIVTIGLAMSSTALFMLLYGANPLPISREIPKRLTIGPVQITDTSLWSAGVALVVLIAVGLVLSRTRIGRATRAVADNPALAAASGIRSESVIRLVWISAGSLAALGGVLIGLYFGSIRFNTGAVILLLMFAAITLGGLGSPLGGLVGALVIGLVVELSTLFLPNDMRYASALAILILVLLIRPQGLLGRAERVG